MYYIGIDIAKFKHDCFIMNEHGEVIKNTFTFDNNHEGFHLLLTELKKLDSKQEIKIGFESTGHYTVNLRSFLQEHNYSFMVLHALSVSKFRQATTLRRTKTDKVDAKLISTYLTTIEYKPYQPRLYHIDALKRLTRYRDSLIRKRSYCLVDLTSLLDHIFPEFKPFFNHRFTAIPLFMLRKYKSAERMAKLNMKHYPELRTLSRGGFSHMKFIQLIELAKKSVGKTNEILELQLDSVFRTYDMYDNEISMLELQIKSIMKNIDTTLTSIMGVSVFTVASLIGEFGDFNNFSNPDKMLSFAGIEPSVNQSGTKDFRGKMVKRGSSHLRYVIMNICDSMLSNNPVFYTYYQKKRNEGKAHWVAISHIAKKFIRLIYKIETEHLIYDVTLLR